MTFAAVRWAVAVRTFAEMAARPKRHTNPMAHVSKPQLRSRPFTMHISSAADQNGPDARRQGATTEAYAVVRRREERSEEHTSELQSRLHLVCRLLLEKKKKTIQARFGLQCLLRRPTD